MRFGNLQRVAIALAVAGHALSIAAAEANSASAAATRDSVVIAVYNQAEVSQKTVLKAEKIASEIFRDAGIETQWINCDVLAESRDSSSCSRIPASVRFDLHILRSSLDLPKEVLGLAFVPTEGMGRHADLFYDSVARMQKSSSVDGYVILGHVAAHELGHLLMGKAHTTWGLMRANWTHEDLSDAARGQLLFSKEQAGRLKAGILLVASENDSSPAEKVIAPAGEPGSLDFKTPRDSAALPNKHAIAVTEKTVAAFERMMVSV